MILNPLTTAARIRYCSRRSVRYFADKSTPSPVAAPTKAPTGAKEALTSAKASTEPSAAPAPAEPTDSMHSKDIAFKPTVDGW